MPCFIRLHLYHIKKTRFFSHLPAGFFPWRDLHCGMRMRRDWKDWHPPLESWRDKVLNLSTIGVLKGQSTCSLWVSFGCFGFWGERTGGSGKLSFNELNWFNTYPTVTSRFSKYMKIESRGESATYIREKNIPRIHAKPKVTWTSYIIYYDKSISLQRHI